VTEPDVERERCHQGADGEAAPAAEAEPGRESCGDRRRESPGDRGHEAGDEQEGRKVREVLRLECIDARPDPEEPADYKHRTERDRMQVVEEGRIGMVPEGKLAGQHPGRVAHVLIVVDPAPGQAAAPDHKREPEQGHQWASRDAGGPGVLEFVRGHRPGDAIATRVNE
jgi:hypothetical protein